MLKPGPEEEMRVAPFHYGSHYSNSGTVLHYLVRLPPFTRMFLTYQGQSQDVEHTAAYLWLPVESHLRYLNVLFSHNFECLKGCFLQSQHS